MIKIPEDLLKINRDNAWKAIAVFDKAKEPASLSFNDFQNFYQGKVFIQKLKTDIWLMQRQIWEAVWGNVLTNLNTKNHEITYLTNPNDCCDFVNDIDDFSVFTVSYELNAQKEINLSIVIYWKEKVLSIYSSLNDEEYCEYPPVSLQTNLTEIRPLPNYLKGHYNKSIYEVSLIKQDNITDIDIDNLRQSALEIVEHINTYLK